MTVCVPTSRSSRTIASPPVVSSAEAPFSCPSTKTCTDPVGVPVAGARTRAAAVNVTELPATEVAGPVSRTTVWAFETILVMLTALAA